MSSRDVWARGGRRTDLKDLISSAFCLALLAKEQEDPIYLVSPWITDFPLLENSFGQFSSLLPENGDKCIILFSDYLSALPKSKKVRIITRKDRFSQYFLAQKSLTSKANIEARFSDSAEHEKGILTPLFYIFGSMNLTYSGVEINGEKITYYSASTKEGEEKIGRAYIEINQLWSTLPASSCE